MVKVLIKKLNSFVKLPSYKTDKLKFKPKSEISEELVEKIINHLN